jgi:hypothetical protein
LGKIKHKNPAKRGQVKPARGQLIMVVRNNTLIIDFLRQEGIRPLSQVHVAGRTYGNAYPVCARLAAEVCARCLQDICACSDKFQAPVILCRRRRGNKIEPLSRAEMPVLIPARAAA